MRLEGAPARDRSRARIALLAGAILAASLLAYAPALDYPYVQDAVPAVLDNGMVQQGTLLEIFTSDYWARTVSGANTLYRPLSVASFALERRILGSSSPWLSHGVNILLHDLAALALFFYARRCASFQISAAAALLFTVHPLLLQGVANVVGRADILATLFSLSALLAHSASGPWPGSPALSRPRERLAAWGTGMFLFLALCSKEIAAATLPLLVVQDWVFRPRPHGEHRTWLLSRAAALAPSLLAVTVFLILRTLAIEAFPGLQELSPQDNVLVGLHGLPRTATAAAMAARYLGLMFFPLRLSADYSGATVALETSLLAPLPFLGLLGLAVVAFLAILPWLSRTQLARPLSMGAWLLLLPYLVIGNVFALNAAGFAERLVYMPTAGFCVLVACGLVSVVSHPRLSRWRGAAIVLFGLLILVAAIHTRRQARMWASLDALYTHAIRVTPASLLAHFGLAELRKQQGRGDEAVRLYEEGLKHSPASGELWEGLGRLRRERGDLAGAEKALRRAIEVNPELAHAHMQLGLILRRTSRPDEAEREMRKALLWNPTLIKPREELADRLFETGRYAEAARYYRACVQSGRADLEPRRRLAESLAAAGTPAPPKTR